MNLKIDSEFESLNRALTEDELKGLKDDIQINGCLNPLITWFDNDILLDGHNRKRICDELGIDYDIETIELPDRHAAINWIIDNQLSRRNLNAEERRYLIGKKYLEEKKEHGGDRKSSGQNDPLIGKKYLEEKKEHGGDRKSSAHFEHLKEPEKTAEKIGKEHGVSQATVRRAADFAEEVDKLELEERRQVLSGEKKIEPKPKKAGEGEPKKDKGLNLKPQGVGMRYAADAIDCLKKIPLKDKLRKEGFGTVKQYIEDNI